MAIEHSTEPEWRVKSHAPTMHTTVASACTPSSSNPKTATDPVGLPDLDVAPSNWDKSRENKGLPSELDAQLEMRSRPSPTMATSGCPPSLWFKSLSVRSGSDSEYISTLTANNTQNCASRCKRSRSNRSPAAASALRFRYPVIRQSTDLAFSWHAAAASCQPYELKT
jgi:hypothetical protein